MYVISDGSEALPEEPTTVGLNGTDAPEGLYDASKTVELDGTDTPEVLPDTPTTFGFKKNFKYKTIVIGAYQSIIWLINVDKIVNNL